MAILYLTEQQAWVGREGECLIVHIPERDGDKRTSRERKMPVPLTKIEEVMVMGDITLTTPALVALLEARINISYLTRYGRYLGSLNPQLSKNSLLRLAQHEAHADLARRHSQARYFVVGKLQNMRTLLMRYNRAKPDPIISNQVESLKRCIGSAQNSRFQRSSSEEKKLNPPELELDSEMELDPEMELGEIETGRMNGLGPLLGSEGAGSAAYFGVFAQLIKCGWTHGFSKRVRRPPTDPVNAMLSYGYTILTSQVASLVSGVGFDPYIGFLHSSRYGRPALALDLMEEFRPLIVDSVVLTLLNNHQLEEADFQQELNSYRMTDAARKIFLQKYEERMQEEITHPLFGYKVSYRRCIELQARLLSKHLLGEVSDYVPFVVR
ncbi:MAG: type I-D CRISPR-associated endonuclease Cas1d [Chloroflexota bacterium]|nr:type I-D CRISPR-associated endonuclease Cas1 [Chloroflexota bacterium]